MAYITTKTTKKGVHYYVVYTDRHGKRRWKYAGKTPDEADELRRQIKAGILPDERSAKPALTFSEFCPKWLRLHSAAVVKPRTKDGYEQVIRCHLDPYFGEWYLDEIDLEDYDEYKATKSEEGMTLGTLNKTLTVLKMIFHDADEWNYIENNGIAKGKKITYQRPEMSFLGRVEIDNFLKAASPEYHALFATALFSGARQGELIALKGRNVDIANARIAIRETYDEKYGVHEPKTLAGKRDILISPRLVRILKQHIEQLSIKPDDLVFPNRAGNYMNAQNMMTREFYPALERAGVKRIRFHDTRHTYAGFLASHAFPLKFIQRQLGHASVVTTLDLYGHLIPEIVERFGEIFDSLFLNA